jgi:hypothetical protein
VLVHEQIGVQTLRQLKRARINDTQVSAIDRGGLVADDRGGVEQDDAGEGSSPRIPGRQDRSIRRALC